jgi:UDP-N-acetylmuramate--alanine ligase
MIAHILDRAGASGAYCVGGEVATLDGVAGAGHGPVVVEADESDGTVGLYHPSIGVITNIEFDHMEHFDSEAAFSACFQAFASQTRDCLIYLGEEPRATEVSAGAGTAKSFGFHEKFEFSGKIVDRSPWMSRFEFRMPGEQKVEISLRLPGDYNVLNAVAAGAAAHSSGVSTGEIVGGLESFEGVRRRFERVPDTGDVVVISDYAHHPTELRAVIEAAGRLDYRRLHAVFQPHRFTRTRALLQQFPQALQGIDHLIIAPVYAASESPLAGGTSQDLVAAFSEQQLPVPRLASSLEEAWRLTEETLEPGDLLLILGAGDVEKIASRARSSYSVN